MRDVCEQVANVNRLISQQWETIEVARRFRVTYEGFCAAPFAFAERLTSEIPGLHVRESARQLLQEDLPCSLGKPLTDEEEQIIHEYFPASMNEPEYHESAADQLCSQ